MTNDISARQYAPQRVQAKTMGNNSFSAMELSWKLPARGVAPSRGGTRPHIPRTQMHLSIGGEMAPAGARIGGPRYLATGHTNLPTKHVGSSSTVKTAELTRSEVLG